MKEVIDLLMTPIMIYMDFIAFKSRATLNTRNVLNIRTDLNADKVLLPDPPLKKANSTILSSTTVPSR